MGLHQPRRRQHSSVAPRARRGSPWSRQRHGELRRTAGCLMVLLPGEALGGASPVDVGVTSLGWGCEEKTHG